MESGFERLKNNRREDFIKILEAFDNVQDSVKYKTRHKHVLEALLHFENIEELMEGEKFHQKITACNHRGKNKKICGSVYCLNCAKRLSDSMRERWKDHLQIDRGRKRSNGECWATTLLGGVCENDLEALNLEVDNLKKRVGDCLRKTSNGFYIEGFIELELIDYRQVDRVWKVEVDGIEECGIDRRRKVNYLRAARKSKGRYQVLVHFHGVISSKVDKDYLREKLCDEFGSDHREVELRKIPYGQQSWDKSFYNWSRYIFKATKEYRKDLYRFKSSFQAVEDEEYIQRNPRLMPHDEIAKLMMNQRRIGGERNKKLLYRRGKA